MMTRRGHKVEHLVRVAYAEALKRKYEDASRTVEQIYKMGGATGLQIALLLWADTYIDHAVDGADGNAPIVASDMAFVRTGPGQAETLGPQPPDWVPEEFRWAGQLFAARAAMDRTQWNELVASVPSGDEGKYVFAVLNALASTVNGLPRGYARMGA